MAPQQTENTGFKINWSLYSGISFIVFGALCILLAFSQFVHNAPGDFFEWLFFVSGTALLLVGTMQTVRGLNRP